MNGRKSHPTPSSAFEQLQQRWKEANTSSQQWNISPAVCAARRRSYTPPRPSAQKELTTPFRNPNAWKSVTRADRVDQLVTSGGIPMEGRSPRQQLLPAGRQSPGRTSGARGDVVPVYRFDPRTLEATRTPTSVPVAALESIRISPRRHRDGPSFAIERISPAREASPGPYETAVSHPLLSSASFQVAPAPRDLTGLVSPTPRVQSTSRRNTPRREFFDHSLEVHAVSPSRGLRSSPRGRNGVAWVVDFGGSRR